MFLDNGHLEKQWSCLVCDKTVVTCPDNSLLHLGLCYLEEPVSSRRNLALLGAVMGDRLKLGMTNQLFIAAMRERDYIRGSGF